MAIDTAAKRRSAGGVPFLGLGPGITPNASKPVTWRQQSAWGYSGIEVGAGSGPTLGTDDATRYRYGYRYGWHYAILATLGELLCRH